MLFFCYNTFIKYLPLLLKLQNRTDEQITQIINIYTCADTGIYKMHFFWVCIVVMIIIVINIQSIIHADALCRTGAFCMTLRVLSSCA